MARRMTSRMRATAAVVAAGLIVTVVVLAQPGGTSKARADSAALAPAAARAPGAPECCPHTHARAQALIKPNGTPVRATGIASTTHVAAGTYCIGLVATVPVATTAPVVTQDVSLSQSPTTMSVNVAIASSAPDCPAGSNSIEVMTFADLGGQRTPADEGFTVVVA